MNFDFTDEQEELRATARSFLADRSASDDVRRAMESGAGCDAELWKQLGAELGWTAVTIPEDCGGLGLTWIELAALLEVMGEFLVCAPFFSTVCLGANAILCAGSEAQQAALLPAIAEGQCRATLAGNAWEAGGLGTTAWRDGDSFVLSGGEPHVLDGHSADLLVIAARLDDQPALFAVPAGSEGLRREARPTMDQTRRLAALELHDVRLPAEARLGGDAADPSAWERVLARATVALAVEQVGGAQRCLDMAVEYAKEREQFGRPIGSFQAIKHTCADMMIAVEAARSGVYYAACAAAEASDELPVLASLAKATASEAYFRCAADSLQIHGGVGFTWEYDVHLHLKRARAGEQMLGDPAFHRERVARAIGLDA